MAVVVGGKNSRLDLLQIRLKPLLQLPSRTSTPATASTPTEISLFPISFLSHHLLSQEVY